jgi:signal transduction histidine kinase/AmiR/NasT family two-component response regulator/HPt (histidine-containing phosphotransfer) domain-containing protein
VNYIQTKAHTLKSKNLLTQISELESALNNFSFEELSTGEATRLKQSFDHFKTELEAKIWGYETNTQADTAEKWGSTREIPSKNKKEAHLIAKVSHEIRTPLNGIMGFADLLQEGVLNKIQKEQVSAIQSASRSLMEIINELLEYSILEAGAEEFNEVPFNLHNLIKEVSYLCETLIVDKKIEFEVETDPNIPMFLLGDPSKLTQVLLNLLGNAIKFVEKGRVSLKTKLKRTRDKKATIEFIISDTGIGISSEDLNHIFDAFSQADQQTFSKYGGAGLGLSIVKQIVDRLGGTIEVQSEINKGTQFNMILDYAIGKEDIPCPTEKADKSGSSVDELKILVFEDNPLNQWLIKKRLNSWGCTHFVTEEAEVGLKILEEEAIDLVFMDLHMPVTDGFEITRRIRASDNPRISRIPVIALTADFSVRDKERAEGDGIDDFILKPYTPEELLDKIVQYGFSKKDSVQDITKPVLPPSDGDTPEKLMELDLTDMLEECMGEVDMLAELVSLFKGNALEFIGKGKLHLQNRDYEQLQFATHKLKSGLAMMRVQNLLILVQQIHEHCKADRNHDQMQYLYDQFVREYPMVEFALEKELTRLRKAN